VMRNRAQMTESAGSDGHRRQLPLPRHSRVPATDEVNSSVGGKRNLLFKGSLNDDGDRRRNRRHCRRSRPPLTATAAGSTTADGGVASAASAKSGFLLSLFLIQMSVYLLIADVKKTRVLFQWFGELLFSAPRRS
jgi:hypothetical protein